MGWLEIYVLMVIGALVCFLRFLYKKFGQSKTEPLICKACGSIRCPIKTTKGSIAIEIVLWLFFIVPGLIYSIWRLTTRRNACPVCGSPDMIPLDTPIGQSLKTKI